MHCYFKRRVVISADAMSDCIVLLDAFILQSCLVGCYVHHGDGFRGLLDVTVTFFFKMSNWTDCLIFENNMYVSFPLRRCAPAELAAIAVLFGAVLLYFPARPPMPPSVAAASQRLSYRSSICRLLR